MVHGRRIYGFIGVGNGEPGYELMVQGRFVEPDLECEAPY